MTQNARSSNSNGVKNAGFGSRSIFKHVQFEHLIAGLSGGVTSTLVLHPLDLLKIRFAVHNGQVNSRPHYKNLRNAVTTIFRDEGVRGFYKGITPNCFGAGMAWGLYFYFYKAIKDWMLEEEPDKTKKTLGPGKHMLAAAETGVLTLVILNPVWVVKTRMCLQYQKPPAELASSSVYYSGMVDALRKVYRYEGIPGLYKGFLPGLFGVAHGVLQFATYEEMKDRYTAYHHLPPAAKLGTLEYLFFSSVSKFIAASTTYPYQVLRARLQDQHKQYSGVWDVICKIYRFEGVMGFYKGLLPNLLKVVPATAITFVVYENISHYLLDT